MFEDNKRNISEYVVLLLAVVGLISVGGAVLQQAIGFVGSVTLLAVSSFGAIWLLNQAKGNRFGGRETAIAIGLIVAGVLLYNFAPAAFPRAFSLVMP
jgi:hypothetical protein